MVDIATYPCPSPSKFIILPVEMDHLTDRIGSESNLSIRRSISIHAMLSFYGDGHGNGKVNGMCKQALVVLLWWLFPHVSLSATVLYVRCCAIIETCLFLYGSNVS